MAKTVVKDYETVEIDREVYICDSCGHEGSKEEFNAIAVVDDPDRDSFRYESETYHACDGCVGKRELSIRSKKLDAIEEEHEERMNKIGSYVGIGLAPFAFIGGFIASPLALLFYWMFWQAEPLSVGSMGILLIVAIIVGAISMFAQFIVVFIIDAITEWITGYSVVNNVGN